MRVTGVNVARSVACQFHSRFFIHALICKDAVERVSQRMKAETRHSAGTLVALLNDTVDASLFHDRLELTAQPVSPAGAAFVFNQVRGERGEHIRLANSGPLQ